MGYRDQGVALTELIAHLIEERARIDEQLAGAEQQLRELTASKKKKSPWWVPSRVEAGVYGLLAATVVSFVGIAWLPQYQCAREHAARYDLGTLKSARELYRMETGKGCPAVDDMIASGALEEGQTLDDPWGNPYLIRCIGVNTFITSAGPDGEHGTGDDI